ncbi:Ataxin-10 [Coemansia sp. Benny D160-2]|nr:Ataxin-10 [Coemansia sp. Benny D160-2]
MEESAAEEEQAAYIVGKCNALGDLCAFVRNAAAMDQKNQDLIDGSGITADICKTILDTVELELIHLEAMSCVAIAAQALSNAITGNRALQEKLLRQQLEHGSPENNRTVYWLLLDSIHQKTNTAGLVLLLNNINDSPELVDLLCTVPSGQKIARKLGSLFGGMQDDESEEKNIVYAILGKIIENGCFSKLVQSDLSYNMYGLFESLAVYCKVNSDNPEKIDFVLDERLVGSISNIFGQIHGILSGLWQVSGSETPNAGRNVDMDSAISAHRCLSAFITILEIATSRHNRRLADLAIDCKLAHRIVELLGLLHVNLPRIQKLDSQALASTKEQHQKQHAEESQASSIERLFMFKCDLIQIIGNLSFKNIAMQDLMREIDGLSLVLDNMRIDDNHPFIKEYAIVALKWLLENNKSSHDYVRSMEAGKPTLDPSIAAPGLETTVDDQNKISIGKSDK